MAATEAPLGTPPLEGPPPAASTPGGPPGSEKQLSLSFPREGEMVVLYASRDSLFSCILESKGVCRTRFGSFLHADVLRTPFGHKVFDRNSGKWLVVLRPTPDLHTLALRHRTQIIYHADIALILSLLDVRPGKTIIEAGTGSGSLSYSLAAALRPGGRLFTFEFHRQRWQEAKDICKEGFCLQPPTAPAKKTRAAIGAATAAAAATTATAAATAEAEEATTAATAAAAAAGDSLPRPHEADGVFLDLPSPWLALKYADEALKGGGRLVTFSPCVEQLHKTLVAAQGLGFQDFQAFEVFAKPWGACVSRPTPLSRQGAKRAKTAALAGPHEEAEEPDHPEEESGPMDHRADTRAHTFPALLSHFLQQPLSPYLSGEPAAAPAATASAPAATAAAASAAVAAEKGSPLDSLRRISAYHYQLPMRGHTGYVACCVRPSEDEAIQPVP